MQQHIWHNDQFMWFQQLDEHGRIVRLERWSLSIWHSRTLYIWVAEDYDEKVAAAKLQAKERT